MSIIYLLVPLAAVLMGFGVWALFWAVNSGQFDDLEDAARAALEPDAQAPLEPAPRPDHTPRAL
jgi:cbb3-type cytochrome oxidase maturation protein